MKKKKYSLPDVKDYLGVSDQIALKSAYIEGLIDGGDVMIARQSFDVALVSEFTSVKVPDENIFDFMDELYSSGLYSFIVSRIKNFDDVLLGVEAVGKDSVSGIDGVISKVKHFVEANKGELSSVLSEIGNLKEELKDSPLGGLVEEANKD